MTIPENPGKRESDLAYAYSLVEMGVPVFCGRLNANGNPDTDDRRWDGWFKTKPGDYKLRRYRPGDAVCAVGGVVLDWLDWDPQHDPDRTGWEWLRDATNGIKPVTRSQTPSGGWHMGIPTLGIAKGKVLKGVDFQGGLSAPDEDGMTRRGFVFIPPTVRPSKTTGEPATYVAKVVGKLRPSRRLNELRQAILDMRDASVLVGSGKTGRMKPSELRDICLEAGQGDQRQALLNIILEWRRKGYDKEDVFNLFVQLVSEMPVYDKRHPWYDPKSSRPDYWFQTLWGKMRHKPDAKPDEFGGQFGPNVSTGDEYISADEIDEERVEWLNHPFLPFGCLVIIDGDPGQGKSVITAGMVARAALGKPALPFGHAMCSEPIACGMIGAEDDIGQAVIGRLRAAGYEKGSRNIWFMKLRRDEHGKIEILTFPHGTERVRAFITANDLKLLIIDPISAFLGDDIHTHNESSVRTALGPIVEIARETGCCIVLVRHLNKDSSKNAMYRGTGSIAFSAIARSGIITGVCPDDNSFALAQVKCSYARRFEGVIRYNVAEWEDNEDVPVIKWGEWDQDLTADDIAKGPKERRGPEPESQDAVRAVLEEMFREKDTWPQKECEKRLRAAGASTTPKTVRKVRDGMNIRPIIDRDPESGLVRGSLWTIKKRRTGGNS
jgi:hypothetical protein